MILHPQYVTDANGKPVSVILPLDEYQSMLRHMEPEQAQLQALQRDLRAGILQGDAGAEIDGEQAFRELLEAGEE